ncbi:hypothetical protein EGW08_016342 [Elysia chlorotica]|uniref:HTH psq-type domain-containing protein n=1 Tax=Elysia chlorotica TaxID=188477 RepID=A0A3S1BAD4_ELYCH|nr:hypothetical protein EGW08_016342 [Elysia chlorotica]
MFNLDFHVSKPKHQNTAKAASQASQQCMAMFTKKPDTEADKLKLKVIRAEVIMTALVAELNLSFASMDTLTKAFKRMFTDSKIAQEFSCARTKSTAIAKDIAKIHQQKLFKRIVSTPFTISTDGSYDTRSRKQFPLVVRTFGQQSKTVQSQLLSIPTLHGSGTGEAIFNLIDETFQPISPMATAPIRSTGRVVRREGAPDLGRHGCEGPRCPPCCKSDVDPVSSSSTIRPPILPNEPVAPGPAVLPLERTCRAVNMVPPVASESQRTAPQLPVSRKHIRHKVCRHVPPKPAATSQGQTLQIVDEVASKVEAPKKAYAAASGATGRRTVRPSVRCPAQGAEGAVHGTHPSYDATACEQ